MSCVTTCAKTCVRVTARSIDRSPLRMFQVRKACGRMELLPRTDEGSSAASSDAAAAAKSSYDAMRAAASSSSSLPSLPQSPSPPSSHGENEQSVKLHKQLGNFLASVVRSRIFYGTLADSICEDYPHKHCWNGERVGE